MTNRRAVTSTRPKRLSPDMRRAREEIAGYGELGVSRRGWHGATVNALLRAGVIEEIRTYDAAVPSRSIEGDWVRVVPQRPVEWYRLTSGEVSVAMAAVQQLQASGDGRFAPGQYAMLLEKLAAHGAAAVQRERDGA